MCEEYVSLLTAVEYQHFIRGIAFCEKSLKVCISVGGCGYMWMMFLCSSLWRCVASWWRNQPNFAKLKLIGPSPARGKSQGSSPFSIYFSITIF